MAMNTTLHIPIDTNVRKKLDIKARKLGFDSTQALIRVWAKAVVDGRTLNFGDDWGEPSDEAAARINKDADEALRGVNVSGPFYNVEDFMQALK
jgi:antitoxin component of RelBE/YafQ-DinJ toxin-antitoxin module